MRRGISGRTRVAGVIGAPIAHSLSPAIQNAWIEAADIDAAYVPFGPSPERFEALIDGFRGGVVRGVNVTAPFKERALAMADRPSARAAAAGAANLLVFESDGAIVADNTDGEGLLAAFSRRCPGFSPSAGPVVVLGAGGAARGAVAAFLAAGAPMVHIVNRSRQRSKALAAIFGDRANVADDIPFSLSRAHAVINATPQGFEGGEGPNVDLSPLPGHAIVMDMVYRPVRTTFLERAESRGLATVDGLAMLIGQASPSFRAFFGREPPSIDVRAVALAALEQGV